MFTQAQLWGVMRPVLQAFFAVLISHGIFESSVAEAGIGFAGSGVTLFFSISAQSATQDAVLSFIRTGIAFIGGYAAQRGWVSPQGLAQATPLVLSIAAAGWGFWAHRNDPSPPANINKAMVLILILPLGALLGGCNGVAPSAAVDTAPAKAQISAAAQKAQAALAAVCRNYVLADNVFDLLALTGRIPQRVIDAETSAINEIDIICRAPPTDARTALAAVERAWAVVLDIRKKWTA